MTDKQKEIVVALENLVFKRFNEDTLFAELKKIFEEEDNLTLELGYEDVEDFSDWNYMCSVENNSDVGGDFDIYILYQRNYLKYGRKDTFGNTFMVTGVGYEFFND
jgi:hypothetical protein